ncbi:MAG: HpcH/HpaI aldolase/citrate lyase family protein [Betaproteobacteria bacterium]|nr:HpcH/HpaI aldolase/citrate lyase family protein [Betaproteobacteria bacterium]MBL8532636.1 HpcH/HpaI aldolase/citrate lyase family protein [Betaproteobacteria bacterium]
MDMPENRFKRALKSGSAQLGCWLSLGSHAAAEIAAGAGFDWLLIDMEHAPNELPSVHAQLHAAAAYPVATMVRPPWNDTVVVKRLLDLGVQTLLIPFVETAEEARRAVAATRYPPGGVRGVSTNSRANRFGRVRDYFARVEEEMCVLIQIESKRGVENLSEIAKVEGLDGIFIGPQDLAAGYGHLGNPGHPEVQEVIAAAIDKIRAGGKAAGILAFAEADAKKWIAHGADFVAVTSDQFLLARDTTATLAKFRP